MPTIHRAWAGPQDLPRLQALLTAGRQQSPHSGYIHPGELEWMLFFNPYDDDPSDFIHLWETPDETLLGFVILTPEDRVMDFYVHPAAEEALLPEMLRWSEAALLAADSDEEVLMVEKVFADDRLQTTLLVSEGYLPEPYWVYFVKDLAQPLPAPVLPEGYTFLPAMEAGFVAQRAAAHASAFHPSKMTPDRYHQFMTAPNYDPARDLAVLTPDGRIVSFAMTWADPVTGFGAFEPVGTHADFQRRGLGRAVMHEGLRRLQASGMTMATVCTEAEDTGNIAFYEACGFTLYNQMLAYTRPIT